MITKSVLNIASYKFVQLDTEWLRELRPRLRAELRSLGVFGTVLLSTEGINLFLAGRPEAIQTAWKTIVSIPAFSDMEYKESWSELIPFKRMKVKLKKEIIPMGHNINPAEWSAPRVSAHELKTWLDGAREVVMLDTRNIYEVDYGTFSNALTLNIRHFRTFPSHVESLDQSLKSKTVVTFCTGGIRCEKAGAFLKEKGFKDVYQLDGGILKYFEEVGAAHYDGGCFVFDDRISLDPALQAEIESALI